jgi:cytochrome c5
MKKLGISIGLFFALTSCSKPTAIVITQADSERAKTMNPNATTELLLEGQKLYDQHCLKCHQFHPTKFGSKTWNKYMPEMTGLAKIDQTTSDKILLYVTTYSKK